MTGDQHTVTVHILAEVFMTVNVDIEDAESMEDAIAKAKEKITNSEVSGEIRSGDPQLESFQITDTEAVHDFRVCPRCKWRHKPDEVTATDCEDCRELTDEQVKLERRTCPTCEGRIRTGAIYKSNCADPWHKHKER